jgi:hypothetical protein
MPGHAARLAAQSARTLATVGGAISAGLKRMVAPTAGEIGTRARAAGAISRALQTIQNDA